MSKRDIALKGGNIYNLRVLVIVFVSLLIGFFFGIKYQNITLKSSPQAQNSISSSTSPKINSIPSKWAKYNSPMDVPVKFSIDYPSDWQVDNLYVEGSPTVYFSPSSITKAPIRVSGYVSGDTLNQYVKQYYCHDKNRSCPDEKGAINVKINGLEAKRLVPYGEINGVTVVVKKNNTFVETSVSLLGNNVSTYTDEALLKIFNQMTSTISF